jgi:hypothetical protein
MEITICSKPDGSVTVHVASILSDLWDDYLYFRQEAKSVDRILEPLRYKRLLRASINAFFNYFDGVLNRWIAKLDTSFDLGKAATGEKIGFIRKQIRGGRELPRLDLEGGRSLRNKICHLKLAESDLDIVDQLLNGRFFSDAEHIVNWLRIASKRLGLECHPDVPKLLRRYGDVIGKPVSNPGGM